MDRAEGIELAMIAESARWGDSQRANPYTKDDHWWPEVEMIVNDYLPARTEIVLGQVRGKGNLSNAGERIELEDALDETILSFRYRDGWYPETDGGGFSLQVADPVLADPNAYGDKATWQPSTLPGGTPGQSGL